MPGIAVLRLRKALVLGAVGVFGAVGVVFSFEATFAALLLDGVFGAATSAVDAGALALGVLIFRRVRAGVAGTLPC